MRQRNPGLVRSIVEQREAVNLLRLAPEAAGMVIHGATTGAVMWSRSSGRCTVDEFARILSDLVLRESS